MSHPGCSARLGTPTEDQVTVLNQDPLQWRVSNADAENVTIGGIGDISGAVNFSSSADSDNVTGAADSDSTLKDSALGLQTNGTVSISSDGNIAGSVGLSSSAAANTSYAEADSDAGTIQGADLGALSIGGIGDIAGSVSFGSSLLLLVLLMGLPMLQLP